MDDPQSYRGALLGSASPSPTRPSFGRSQAVDVPTPSFVEGIRAHNPKYQPSSYLSCDDQQELLRHDAQRQQRDFGSDLRAHQAHETQYKTEIEDEDGNENTPPATPTTFAAQARNIDHGNGKDHRRLSSLCLDIREAAESRGTTGDIRRACQWLLNREGVPQRLRGILWEQLLRGRDEIPGDGLSGEDGDDEQSSDDDNTLDAGIVDGVKRARVMGVWRRTSADPEVVGRLCTAALARAERVQATQRSNSDTRLQVVGGELVGLQGPISPRREALPLLPEEDEDYNTDVEMMSVEGEHDAAEKRLDAPLAKETEKKAEVLEQLRALAMDEPTFGPKCTCAAQCRCVYGVSKRRISRPAAAALTIRAAAAGMGPTDGGSPTSGLSPTSLGWYDRKSSSEGKMPERKRDSIRSRESEMTIRFQEPLPRT